MIKDTGVQGNYDPPAGLLSIADGIAAYGKKDNNDHGNIVDGLIAGLRLAFGPQSTCRFYQKRLGMLF